MTRKHEGNERRYRHRPTSEWPRPVKHPKEPKYNVHLACGHRLYFPAPLPRPGDVLLCTTCDQPMRVVEPPRSHETDEFIADQFTPDAEKSN